MSRTPHLGGSLSGDRVIRDPVALWTSNAFVEEARAWVEAQLAMRGSRLTGEWQQLHARVWPSTVRFEKTECLQWADVDYCGGTSREGRPTARPLILCGLISMNRFRTPSAHGTGPVSQAEVSK